MPKWCKAIIGILLLPICIGGGWALGLVVRDSGNADTVWVAIVSGAACWWVIYLLLPKPMWIYVVGHELTHALWTWLFGGRVKKFRASSKGGHVVVTKSNFLIALAPYFFPLYALLVVGVFLTGRLVWNWPNPLVWFHLMLGGAYAFHVTLTWHVLRNKQSDITEQGYLFSAVVIFLGNVSVLLIAIPVLTPHGTLLSGFQHWFACTRRVLQAIAKLILLS